MNTSANSNQQILLVTGFSGAGKSTALHTLEDIGWETVDNLPLSLFEELFETTAPSGQAGTGRPLAIGIDSRTHGFDAGAIVERIKALESEHGLRIETVFLECGDQELARRFSETRRRHPLAQDRPAQHGIAREREVLMPLRRWAEHVIDTTDSSVHDLRQEIRTRFAGDSDGEMTITVSSFGYARGVLRNADLVFDMRFLRNPHWDEQLRPQTGRDRPVIDHIAEDPVYDEAMQRIEELILLLLPRYKAEGKSYITLAFGCTGGRHRSVHIAERIAERLRSEGFSPTIAHRDLASVPADGVEGAAAGRQ